MSNCFILIIEIDSKYKSVHRPYRFQQFYGPYNWNKPSKHGPVNRTSGMPWAVSAFSCTDSQSGHISAQVICSPACRGRICNPHHVPYPQQTTLFSSCLWDIYPLDALIDPRYYQYCIYRYVYLYKHIYIYIYFLIWARYIKIAIVICNG